MLAAPSWEGTPEQGYQGIYSGSYYLHFLIDYVLKLCYIAFPSLLIEGRLRRHPEGGAGSGVLRRRLVTVCLGRPGTPPARHYDLAARSSLHGSGRQMP